MKLLLLGLLGIISCTLNGAQNLNSEDLAALENRVFLSTASFPGKAEKELIKEFVHADIPDASKNKKKKIIASITRCMQVFINPSISKEEKDKTLENSEVGEYLLVRCARALLKKGRKDTKEIRRSNPLLNQILKDKRERTKASLHCAACFIPQKNMADGIHMKSCGGCQSIFYCSKKCQTTDWKEHKKVCKPLPKIGLD